MRSQFLTLVISALILARARIAIGLAWRGPEPTLGDLAKEKAHMGFTPRPTNGPNLFKDVRGDLKLLKRNIGENTCGYESAVASLGITCSPGRTCYFFTVANIWGMAGCCTAPDLLNCGWVLDCVDSRAYLASCGFSCQTNQFTRKCTNAASPYCQTFTYPDVGVGVVDYDCGTDSASTYRTMRAFYSGQALLGSFTFNTASLTMTRPGIPATSPSTTRPPVAPTDGSSRKSSVPIGAIVGGVLGGLLVLLLVIGGVLFYLFYLRRRRNQAASAGQRAPQGSAPHPVSNAGYEPVQQHVPPVVQSPPPQYYAPVPEKVNPLSQAQEMNSRSWYGEHPVSPQEQHQQHQQHFEGNTSPPANQTVSPESTLAGHNRPSYISVPSVDSPELHGQSASQVSPPIVNYNNDPIYEAPANQAPR